MASDALAELAQTILDVRIRRDRDLPGELFGGELAYELLLVLFVADANGQRLSGRMALAKVGGSQRVGRRWIEYLTRRQLIVGDGDGNLDDTLTLTPRALNALEQWLSDARERFGRSPQHPSTNARQSP